MKHLEGEFEGVKGFKIYYQAWLPESPKAIIQLVHGGFEHSGRYQNVIDELIPHNYAIYADDHRGHGRSEGIRNHIDSFDQYIEDEKIFYDLIKGFHPNLPIFMLGHSLGSFIAIYFTKKYENFLDGLILSGTGTGPGKETSGFLKAIAKGFSKIAPKMKFNPRIDTQFLSHDLDVVKKYENDTLVNAKKITARLSYEMLNNFKNLKSFIGKFKINLLVQCGSEDKLIQGSENLKNLFKMPDKTIKIYEGLYHEVYNELEEDRKKVLKDLSNWLNIHVSQ
ncbi:MAG: alpha/beta hydrolase [Candidatus Odinarchaeota archaeon]